MTNPVLSHSTSRGCSNFVLLYQLKKRASISVISIPLLSCEVPESPGVEKNTGARLPVGLCGACVSTLGAISFPLVSEFLPLFGWALHKLLGESKGFFRKWNI